MAESMWKLTDTLKSTIVFSKTALEMADLLVWLIVDVEIPSGMTTAQENQWKLDQAHKVAMQAVMAKIRENQAKVAAEEERANYQQGLDARLAAIRADTGIVEEPPGQQQNIPLPPM